VPTAQTTDPALLEAYRRLLPPEEVRREQQFRQPWSRLEYLVSRVLARVALSAETGEPLAGWQFVHNAHGKPAVASEYSPPLEFNLSHTRGLVVCGVSRLGPVGVDVEELSRPMREVDFARRFFAPSEAAALESAADAERHELFFRFWTLKEAWLKAVGLGLSFPLERFAFSLADNRSPRLTLPPDYPERADHWTFGEVKLGGQHQVAVVVRAAGVQPMSISLREVVPLGEHARQWLLPPTPNSRWIVP
jgi:4'-phosphopantetheinyl transferase